MENDNKVESKPKPAPGKTKAGKYCPFRDNNRCGSFCGLWCEGLQACVFHAINYNLNKLHKSEGIEKP